MKIIRDSIGAMFVEYMQRITWENSLNPMQVADISGEVLNLIVDASYTLQGEASSAFHTAMGNCKVGRPEIAELMNNRRRLEGKREIGSGAVKSNLNYARKIIREYLDKEIGRINV